MNGSNCRCCRPPTFFFTRTEWKDLLQEYPEISDPAKGKGLYGIPAELLNELRDNIINGSGGAVQER